MIKIVNLSAKAETSGFEIENVSSQSLLSGVIAAFGEVWAVEEAAEYLLAESVRRTIEEDVLRPSSRFQPRFFDVQALLGEAGADVSSNVAQEIIDVLQRRDLVGEVSPLSNPPLITLTTTGVQRGIVLIGRFAEHRIPASDRIVTLNHNDPGLAEIHASLAALERQLSKGNDLGDMTDADKEAAEAEVSQLDLMLRENKIRISSFIERAQSTLKWIADKAGGALVGVTALAVLKMIASYFGLF